MGDCPDPGNIVASDESVAGRRATSIVHLFEPTGKTKVLDRAPKRVSPSWGVMGVDRIVPNLSVADVGRAHRLYTEVFASAWAWTSAGSATLDRPTRPPPSSR